MYRPACRDVQGSLPVASGEFHISVSLYEDLCSLHPALLQTHTQGSLTLVILHIHLSPEVQDL